MIRRVQDDLHPEQAFVVKFIMQLPEFKMRSAGMQALRIRLQRQTGGLLMQSHARLMQSGVLQTFRIPFNEQFTPKLSPR